MSEKGGPDPRDPLWIRPCRLISTLYASASVKRERLRTTRTLLTN